MLSRDLSVVDCAKIAEFFKENFDDGWTEKMLLSAFGTGRFNAICGYVDGCAVGIITFSFSGDTADIEDLVVKKEERKKGYGLNLLNIATDKIFNSGINRVMLEVREGNVPAIALYKKAGFNVISVRKKYYSDGENALVMLKESQL